MIDPKFLINIAQDIFRQLTQMLYTHHSIARIHRNKMHAEGVSKEEKEIQKQISEFLMGDRTEFFEFIQHTAIDFISEVIQQKATSGEEEQQNLNVSR